MRLKLKRKFKPTTNICCEGTLSGFLTLDCHFKCSFCLYVFSFFFVRSLCLHDCIGRDKSVVNEYDKPIRSVSSFAGVELDPDDFRSLQTHNSQHHHHHQHQSNIVSHIVIDNNNNTPSSNDNVSTTITNKATSSAHKNIPITRTLVPSQPPPPPPPPPPPQPQPQPVQKSHRSVSGVILCANGADMFTPTVSQASSHSLSSSDLMIINTAATNTTLTAGTTVVAANVHNNNNTTNNNEVTRTSSSASSFNFSNSNKVKFNDLNIQHHHYDQYDEFVEQSQVTVSLSSSSSSSSSNSSSSSSLSSVSSSTLDSSSATLTTTIVPKNNKPQLPPSSSTNNNNNNSYDYEYDVLATTNITSSGNLNPPTRRHQVVHMSRPATSIAVARLQTNITF